MKKSIASLLFTAVMILLILQSFTNNKNDDLLMINDRGGEIVRIPGFDLRKEGVIWGRNLNPDSGEGDVNQEERSFVYLVGEDGVGYYKVDRSITSKYTIPLKPNRSYVISVLMKPEFDRYGDKKYCKEVNIGLRTYDGGGKNIIDNLNGIPISESDDWIRWEWEFTVDQRAYSGRLHINTYQFEGTDNIKFADIAFVELPPKPLVPFAKGEGVTFRGGPGDLPMRIEKAEVTGDSIIVKTTGSQYTFDTESDIIVARQMLENERDVSEWISSQSLSGLEILSQNEIECVIANENVTFGIQCDGLMMIAPHNEIELKCTSRIGGEWNRLASGHLFVLDGWGGFAVNPDIPLGSGRMARLDANIRTGRVRGGELDFSGYEDNKTFISSAEPGWEVKWYISPGERLGISVFPPRPYPWKQSFEKTFTITNSTMTKEGYEKMAKYSGHVWMWDFFRRGWGGSFFTKFELRDEQEFIDHVKMIQDLGMTACPYMSPYFYSNRDPEMFASEVKRIKDAYGVKGVYYDGIPSQEWIAAYEMMRMTREVMGDGIIIYHNTGHASNGTAPLGEPSLKIPAIETYADYTYGGERVWGYGKDWVYPKYIPNQYRLSNCIGAMKSGAWEGLEPYQRDLLMLKYNGRAAMLDPHKEFVPHESRVDIFSTYYFKIVNELKILWEEYGDEPDFYEKYYLPKFEELTKGIL